MSKPIEVSSLKVGGFAILEGKPCKITSIDKSKPGKHGSAKARIVGIDIFDGSKVSIVLPVNAKIQVPIIDKRVGQVLSIQGPYVQLMDMETYETLELPLPEEEEIKSKIEPGIEVEYWRILDRSKIVRIRSGTE